MTQVSSPVVLLSPLGEAKHREMRLAPRLSSLKGAAIAVVNGMNDPERSRADVLVKRVGELLLKEGAGQIINVRKPVASADLPQEMLDSLAGQAQGVVVLEGD